MNERKRAKEILDDINNKIANRKIFKYNRESLIQALIIAFNKAQFQAFYYGGPSLTDQIIEQYRAILKFIFWNDNEKSPIPNNNKTLIYEFEKMALEFMDEYTPVRNYLDQCIIGTREFKYDETMNIYYEDNYNSFSNYARMIDKVKEQPSEDLKTQTIERMGKFLGMNMKINVFKDRLMKSLMESYIKICWLDSEIKFDYDFGDYTYDEIIRFCAALDLVAYYYSITLLKNPYPCIKYDEMENGISKLSDLPIDKVKLFLKYHTYDFNYQKDKLTLIQGLIKCNERYYFNPNIFTLSLLPIKTYRLINDYEGKRYEIHFSKIAKMKEQQMTDEIVSKLEKYDISVKTGYKYIINNKLLAEYDLLIFDNITNNLYICELKWYFIADGEKEHYKIDNRISEAVEHRKEKNKYILDNPQYFCDELFEKKKCNKVYEILISQNYSGNIEQDMVVIDFDTLQWSVGNHDSFEELMGYFLKKEYLNSIPTENIPVEIEIEGYKFKIYRIARRL